jgi:hypothetical protein
MEIPPDKLASIIAKLELVLADCRRETLLDKSPNHAFRMREASQKIEAARDLLRREGS